MESARTVPVGFIDVLHRQYYQLSARRLMEDDPSKRMRFSRVAGANIKKTFVEVSQRRVPSAWTNWTAEVRCLGGAYTRVPYTVITITLTHTPIQFRAVFRKSVS